MQPPATRDRTAFDGYYHHYLSLHQTRGCRWLHAAGLGGVLLLAALAWWSGWWWVLLPAPLVAYGCAWAGHFLFERNAPATFRNPWLAFLSYWRMTWDTVCGRQPL